MIITYLYKLLLIILAVDVVLATVYVVFLVNARINLKRQFIIERFSVRAIKTAQKSESTEQAAEDLNMTVEEFEEFCRVNRIETPEVRKERIEAAEKRKKEEMRKILEEEATWRAEQERIAETRRLEQEEDARKRKQRLKKFGIS